MTTPTTMANTRTRGNTKEDIAHHLNKTRSILSVTISGRTLAVNTPFTYIHLAT